MPLVLLTTLALFAFAANSVLCRLALGSGAIDPVSFTLIRLLGGALVLLAIFYAMQGKKESGDQQKGSWPSSIALFLYAMSFSLAYLSLSSGTGALILFGSVQVTMLVAALKRGEKLQSHQWLGFGIALGGIAYLVSPGVSAPDWRGALLMSLSGVAWGLYSIAGRAVTSPIAMTMGNFVRAAMIAIVASLFTLPGVELKSEGVILALLAGVLSSGLGYVIWYQVLPSLSTTQAAFLQLLVPLLAAFGGVIFISESVSLRLGLASFLILGGVGLSLKKKAKAQGHGP